MTPNSLHSGRVGDLEKTCLEEGGCGYLFLQDPKATEVSYTFWNALLTSEQKKILC